MLQADHALTVARILQKDRPDLTNLDGWPEPWGNLARVGLDALDGGGDPWRAVEDAINQSDGDRDAIRGLLYSAGERLLSEPEPVPELPDCPPLPGPARLTAEQEAEAPTAGRWLDNYVAFGSEASPLTPQAFHVAAGLAAGSLAIARRLCLRVSVETNTIYPNLYCLYVGHSTRPRKTTGNRVLRGLLHKAGLAAFLLADRQTPEALTLDLTTQIPKTYENWTPEQQEQWLEERAIAAQRGWLLEEASHLLDSFNRDYTSGLLPLVLDLHDASDRGPSRNTIGRGREQITEPYLSIFGVTTYAAMANHAKNPAHWNNGLWARFALVGSDESGAWRFWPPPLEYPAGLVERLHFLAFSLLPMPEATIQTREEHDPEAGETKQMREVVVNPPLTAHAVIVRPEAWAAWECYSRAVSYDMLPEQEAAVPARFYASYGRLGTTLVKVAMILAALDAERLPVAVEARHVYRAQMIVEGWRANLHHIFDRVKRAGQEDETGRIRSILAERGRQWTTRRDLLRKLPARWSEISALIDDLEAAGEIEREAKRGQRGPASEQYRLALKG